MQYCYLCSWYSLYSKSDPVYYLWKQNWPLNSNLTYKTLLTRSGSGLLISVLEKHNFFHLTSNITLVLLMWKWISLFLKKRHLWRCWDSLCLLNCIRALTLSLLVKLPHRSLKLWFIPWHWSSDSFHGISIFWGCSISL